MYAGMDTETGTVVTITEWVLKWCHYGSKKNNTEKDKESIEYMKQVICSCVFQTMSVIH